MGPRIRPLAWLVATWIAVSPAASAGEPDRHRVVKGAIEARGDAWVAGSEGAVVELPDGVVLRLGPGAVLERKRSVALPLGGKGKTRTHSFALTTGRVTVANPQGKRVPAQGVLFELPKDLSVITAGGHLDVSSDGSVSSAVNREGTAWATFQSVSRRLGPGRGVRVKDQAAEGLTLAAAPALSAQSRVFSGVSGPVPIGGLTWTAVEGAKGYAIRLFRDDPTSPLEVQQLSGLAQPRPFGAVPPGSYRATVAAIDAQGLEGEFAPAVNLRVVGLSLPAGASVTPRGSVVVPERAPVSFTHADGLLAAIGPSSTFAPVPSEITLRNGDTTLIRLRDPGEGPTLNVLLRPRRLTVAVTVGPKHLCWPGANANVSIHARDAETHEPVPAPELRPEVTLGVDPMPVEFVAEDGALRGVLATPEDAGRGPWILRVQVNDAFGTPIGRDFVEIDRCAPARPVKPTAAASRSPSQG